MFGCKDQGRVADVIGESAMTFSPSAFIQLTRFLAEKGLPKELKLANMAPVKAGFLLIEVGSK